MITYLTSFFVHTSLKIYKKLPNGSGQGVIKYSFINVFEWLIYESLWQSHNMDNAVLEI